MASPTKKKKAIRKAKAAPNKVNAKADAKRINENIETIARLWRV
jgi:hypothetical protein